MNLKKITELNLVRPYFGMIPLINYEKPGFGRTVRSWWNLPDDLWQGVSQISSSHQRRWELSSNQDSECKGFFFSSTIGWFVLGYSQLPLVYHLPKYHQPFTIYHWCIIYPNTIRFDYVRLFIYHWFQQLALFIHHKPLVNKSLFPPLPSGNHPWVAGKSTV